jgi:hypothetical protein
LDFQGKLPAYGFVLKSITAIKQNQINWIKRRKIVEKNASAWVVVE